MLVLCQLLILSVLLNCCRFWPLEGCVWQNYGPQRPGHCCSLWWSHLGSSELLILLFSWSLILLNCTVVEMLGIISMDNTDFNLPDDECMFREGHTRSDLGLRDLGLPTPLSLTTHISRGFCFLIVFMISRVIMYNLYVVCFWQLIFLECS